MKSMSPPDVKNVTSIIIHDVQKIHHADYEKTIRRFQYLLKNQSGFKSLDILRPLDEGVRYIAVLRFESTESAEQWFKSPCRFKLIEEIKPWLNHGDIYRTYIDPDFWFNSTLDSNQPRRWKKFVLSWIGVLPWSICIPTAFITLSNHYYPLPKVLITLFISLVISCLMTYISMPFLTKKMAWWLIK